MLSKRYFKTIDEVEVTFEMERPDAAKVEWVADATGWSPMEMKRSNRGKGPWKLKVRLPKDRPVQFRYRVDEAEWDNDDAADAYWPNDMGSDNSVVLTG